MKDIKLELRISDNEECSIIGIVDDKYLLKDMIMSSVLPVGFDGNVIRDLIKEKYTKELMKMYRRYNIKSITDIDIVKFTSLTLNELSILSNTYSELDDLSQLTYSEYYRSHSEHLAPYGVYCTDLYWSLLTIKKESGYLTERILETDSGFITSIFIDPFIKGNSKIPNIFVGTPNIKSQIWSLLLLIEHCIKQENLGRVNILVCDVLFNNIFNKEIFNKEINSKTILENLNIVKYK